MIIRKLITRIAKRTLPLLINKFNKIYHNEYDYSQVTDTRPKSVIKIICKNMGYLNAKWLIICRAMVVPNVKDM